MVHNNNSINVISFSILYSFYEEVTRNSLIKPIALFIENIFLRALSIYCQAPWKKCVSNFSSVMLQIMLAIYLALSDDHFESPVCYGSVFALVVMFQILPYFQQILCNLTFHIFQYVLSQIYFSFFCVLHPHLLNLIVCIFQKALNFLFDQL